MTKANNNTIMDSDQFAKDRWVVLVVFLEFYAVEPAITMCEKNKIIKGDCY